MELVTPETNKEANKGDWWIQTWLKVMSPDANRGTPNPSGCLARKSSLMFCHGRANKMRTESLNQWHWIPVVTAQPGGEGPVSLQTTSAPCHVREARTPMTLVPIIPLASELTSDGSECGLRTRSRSIAWELVSNAESWAHSDSN